MNSLSQNKQRRSVDFAAFPFLLKLVMMIGLLLLLVLVRLLLAMFVDSVLINVIVLVPLLLSAWLFGAVGGATFGLLLFVLWTIFQITNVELIADPGPGNSLIGLIAITLVGSLFGRVRDAGKRAQLELQQRKEAEEALRQSEARYRLMADNALKANRAKSDLLAKVSHELRTPLTAIIGYTELVEEGVYGPLTEKQKQFLVKALGSAEHLKQMVGDLLDLARLEQGKETLDIQPFVLADLVDGVVSEMSVLAKEKALALDVAIAEDVPVILPGDAKRLRQILTNLVSNAIKFTEKGRVQVRLFCPNKTHWAMQVADTGTGISAAAQAHIFEPFHQAESASGSKQGGIGLGLALVKQFALLMGGDVSLESQLGFGSTFTVKLPLTPASSQEMLPFA